MKTAAVMILLVVCMAFGESNVHVWGSRASVYGLDTNIPDGQFTEIYSGSSANTVMAVDENGTLSTWGEFTYGTGQPNVIYGETSIYHSALVKANGEVRFSNQNTWSDGPYVSVAMGSLLKIALREDGTLRNGA